MRRVLGIDDKTDILAYIESLPTPEEQEAAHAEIEKVEEAAMNKMVPPRHTLLTLDCARRIDWLNESSLPHE